MNIRKTINEDHTQLWNIFMKVVKTHSYFMQDVNTTYNEWERYWLGKQVNTYSVIEGSNVVGSYIIKPNQPGLGNHVANGSYMVDETSRGKGIGKIMANHSIKEAKRLGYKAIQFNAVVSNNQAAIKLWKKYGFQVVGTNPKAFRHKDLGLIDTYTMYKQL